jgi:putative ABC transport system permease protein
MTWWGRLLKRGRLERELDAELRDHYERQLADFIASGMPDAEARRRARLALGGDDQIKEQCRDARGTRWLESLAQDLRYAVRMLAHSPMFTSVAVLSLALGIGANTAIFSIVNSLLVRSLPVRAPEQLVLLEGGSWTNPIWEQIRDRHHGIFDGVAAFGAERFDLSRGGVADLVPGLWTSGELFQVLGVPAMLGRTLTAADDRRNGGPDGPVTVISYRFWQNRFGGAADAIGRSLIINGVSTTIIGVTPPEFFGPVVGQGFDVAVPIGLTNVMTGHSGTNEQGNRLDERSFWWLEIIGRLRPTADIDGTTIALRAVQRQIREATLPGQWSAEMQKQYLADPFRLVSASRGPGELRREYRLPVLAIMAVVGLVLLIACANLANLLLARANERRHELAMRRALGASAVRLARQLLLESLLLGGVGAVLGLLLAGWGSHALVQLFSTPDRQVFLDVAPDRMVLAFTAGVGLATALLFGLAPALRAARVDPTEAVKEHGRIAISGRSRALGGPLVVAQIALSLVLLVAAGLFLRTFRALAQIDPGFDRHPVIVANVDAQRSTLPGERRAELYESLRVAVQRVAGVSHAGVSVIVPMSGAGWNSNVTLPPGATKKSDVAWFNAVTPGFFAAYGTTVLAGRDFNSRDLRTAPLVALINEAFTRTYLNRAQPIGLSIECQMGPFTQRATIVGVVEDAIYRSLREGKPPTIYLPLAQLPPEAAWPFAGVAVRVASGSAAPLTRSIASAITRVDPNLSISFRPLAQQVDASMVTERMIAVLSAFFGALALSLAAIGLYGVTAYGVSLRRAEIGVRMALGADAKRVVGLILGRVGRLVAVGVLTGAAISYWATRFVAALLFGLEPHDVATFAVAALTLATVGFVAAWLPARRAARIDPASVLREG